MGKRNDIAPGATSMDVVSRVKECLSEERHKIELFEIVGSEVRKTIALTGEDQFPQSAPWSEDGFRDRVTRYNDLLRDLIGVHVLLGFWSTPAFRNSLALGTKRFSDPFGVASGNTGWLSLRWYPCLLLLYAGGVAAVAGKQYANLRELFHATTAAGVSRSGQSEPFAKAVVDGSLDVVDAFKLLPGHERYHVARSEYLFRFLQPHIADILFLGSEYEAAFDRFEVLLALEYAHLDSRTHDRVWGPVGRFGWKYSRGSSNNPYAELVSEATASGPTWPPLSVGLFGGSSERFQELAKSYAAYLGRSSWL